MAGRDLVIRVDEELELRLLDEGDEGPVYRAVDSSRDHLRRFLPFVDPSRSPADTLVFIRSSQSAWAKGEAVNMGIWYRGEAVGCLGTAHISREHDAVEIGYWLVERLQGRGVMYRCCRAFIDHLFQERGAHRVVIRTDVENERSRALAERLGFTFEGTQREAIKLRERYHDSTVYSMLAQDWPAERAEDRPDGLDPA